MRTLLVIRHAIAHPRDRRRWPDDSQRPLTAPGKRKFARTARTIGEFLSKPDALFTSPYKRARQTARILRREAGFPKPQKMNELSPEGAADRVIAALRRADVNAAAIVGHEPALSSLVSELLLGSRASLRGQLKKGGLVLLEFAREIAAGKARLLAYAPPRALRRRKN